MDCSAGGLLKITVTALVMALLTAGACAGVLSGKAEARANIRDYLVTGPNGFYPGGHGVNGSATKAVIDVLGWNATRIMGNVGIGDGSVSIFNQTSTMDVDYPAAGFMCGDVSTQPWEPDNAKSANNTVAESGKPGEGNGTANATDGSVRSIFNGPGQYHAESENRTYAMYHPIWYLNPVTDLLYEHPLATSGTAYCELLGFRTPSGDIINVGMKCTGYGY